MLLKEYIKNLQDLVKKNPKAAGMKVLSAGDDEGNYFNEVYFPPSLGYYDGCEFYTEENLIEMNEEEEGDEEVNSVCIN